MIALWAGISVKLHNVYPSYYLITMPGFLHTLLLFWEADVMSDTKTESIQCLCYERFYMGVSLLIVESGEFFGVIRLFPETQVSVSVCRLYRINSNRSSKIHSTCTLYKKNIFVWPNIFVLNICCRQLSEVIYVTLDHKTNHKGHI